MAKNIFQVLEESDLNEIIEDHPRNLVLVMFSSKTCAPCMSIRPKFISLANENPDCFFVYVDMPNFNSKTDKYKVEGTPTFTFYFNGEEVGKVVGAQEESLVATLNYIKMRIEEMKREAQELAQVQAQPQQDSKVQENSLTRKSDQPLQAKRVGLVGDDLVGVTPPGDLQTEGLTTEAPNNMQVPMEVSIEHKLDILKRLYDLSQHGVQLCKNYGIDSDYREMVWEYNMHVNNLRQQQAESFHSKAQAHQQMPQNSEIAVHQESELEKQQKELINQQLQQLKKHEQIRKVQELNKLNYALQTDQIYKLQQLRNMQRMKENAEKQRSHNNKGYGSEDSEDSEANDRRHNNRKYRTKN